MGFFKTKPRAIPKNPNVSGYCSPSGWQAWIDPLWKSPKILRAEYMESCSWKGAIPGVETPGIPDVVDVVDTGDVVEGVGVGGLRWVRRVRQVE